MSEKKEIFEIERKFLVKHLPPLDGITPHSLRQAYISTSPTIRIRKWDDEYILTVKGSGAMKKTEYELPLSREQFEGLSKKTEGRIISKKRYKIPLSEALTAELDIYGGEFEGFMNVEVEFKDVRCALLFDPPEWFGREITQDRRYSNGSLSANGVPEDYEGIIGKN